MKIFETPSFIFILLRNSLWALVGITKIFVSNPWVVALNHFINKTSLASNKMTFRRQIDSLLKHINPLRLLFFQITHFFQLLNSFHYQKDIIVKHLIYNN
jgi:hypothetical protein